MSRYLETARQLRQEVNAFLSQLPEGQLAPLAVSLGHLLNLAVRCHPRPCQGTVRRNTIAVAMRDWCEVTMERVQVENGRGYNRIDIKTRE